MTNKRWRQKLRRNYGDETPDDYYHDTIQHWAEITTVVDDSGYYRQLLVTSPVGQVQGKTKLVTR